MKHRIRLPQRSASHVLRNQQGLLPLLKEVVGGMERQVGVAPIVQCPGCNQPMEPKERAQVTDRLVDIRYVCALCGMETKRTVREEQ